MIKPIIIDDEKHGIITLEHLISELPEVELVASAQDSTAAKSLIEKHRPDIVFLDIEMPVMNGFEVLKQFDTLPFKVIFTTAYDQYAIKALKMNALDYLLKPISAEDLEESILKYKSSEMQVSREQIAQVHQFVNGKIPDTLALSTQQGQIFIKTENISYLEADGSYTHIVMSDKTKHLASKPLSNFEDILQDNALFFRAQKSFIINLKNIRQYIRGEGGDIMMEDGKNIALSRNKKQEFLGLFYRI
ncbi:MAG: DNA-binding response regulator [Chryseobacterium sp. 39-10]|nr:response regulator transcription factor [Chryseobacterium sp.]OJV48462.1 MAG: DNA-binding response regulator [Chryseobacterium sp. 39-10]